MRFFRRLLISLGLVLAFLLPAAIFAPEARAAVCVEGVTCINGVPLPAVTVTVPGPVRTVTERVTLPGTVRTVTQRIPGPTVTKTVTKTTTQRIPGPVSTVTLVKPGAVKTVVVRPNGQTTTIGQQMAPSGKMVTPTATVTVTKTVNNPAEETKESVIKVTRPQAAGLSVGFIVLGVILGALLLFWAYRSGYLESENKNIQELEELRDDTHEER
jgi:hypothetical protein